MDRKLLSLYGLKYNPFSPDVPVEALYLNPRVEHFCWRIETMTRDGGFAQLTGDPGLGKSAALRMLEDRLGRVVDLKVGVVIRPQGGVADFYRELGDLFGVQLSPHNRWAGAKVLRARWLSHIEHALFRPVLLVDDAQEMASVVLTELRLLSSACLDSKMLLTVLLAGDGRLPERFRGEDLLALGTRMRARLLVEPAAPADLLTCLEHRLKAAGNPKLATDELKHTLCEHAAGNMRALLTMGDQLLAEAALRQARQIDEKLYLEVFTVPKPPPAPKPTDKRRRR
jgi:type II secretory pathway predicted ATPase ExeA